MVRNIIKGKKDFWEKSKTGNGSRPGNCNRSFRYIACQSRNMRWNGGKYDRH